MAAGDDSTGTTNNLTDDGLSTVLTPLSNEGVVYKY
jgi:hypothetical protein